MKKLLILVGKSLEKHQYFRDYLEKSYPEVEVDLYPVDQVWVEIKNGEVSYWVNNKNLLDYDLVFIRTQGQKGVYLVSGLMVYLTRMKKSFVDKGIYRTDCRGDKLTLMVRLALASIPVVPSLYFSIGELFNHHKEIIEKIGFPMVAKDILLQHSTGIYTLRKEEDFEQLKKDSEEKKEPRFIFQPMLDKEEEYRVLVLGGKAVSAQKMRRDLSGFKATIKGSERKEDFVDIKSLPPQAIEISQKAAIALDIEVAGVDLFLDKKGRWWILEVNLVPGLTYDVQISPEIPEISKYLFAKLIQDGK